MLFFVNISWARLLVPFTRMISLQSYSPTKWRRFVDFRLNTVKWPDGFLNWRSSSLLVPPTQIHLQHIFHGCEFKKGISEGPTNGQQDLMSATSSQPRWLAVLLRAALSRSKGRIPQRNAECLTWSPRLLFLVSSAYPTVKGFISDVILLKNR